MALMLTTIFCSDMEKSLAFYRDLLELPLVDTIRENGRHISFLGSKEGTKLELIVGAGAPKPSESISIGIAPSDIQKILQIYQGPVEGPISPNPHLTFWFLQDPDGYRVQLLQTT